MKRMALVMALLAGLFLAGCELPITNTNINSPEVDHWSLPGNADCAACHAASTTV